MPPRVSAADLALVEQLRAAHPALLAEAARRAACKFNQWFPDTGPLRRELYVPHVRFMAAGREHQERIFMAANKVGKTQCAGYEVTCHLTGRYPKWWEGRRFDRPTRWWAAGDTMETTRDILQECLLGPHEGVPRLEWTGMIPPHLVHHATRRLGAIPNCIGAIHVKHEHPDGTPDGISTCEFKSYDQGRVSFQGTDRDGVWLDEEPPDGGEKQQSDIYTECLMRIMVTGGMLIGTFTPLRGLTTFIQQYLDSAVMPDLHGGLVSAKGLMQGADTSEDA